jgi:hypothetical protein
MGKNVLDMLGTIRLALDAVTFLRLLEFAGVHALAFYWLLGEAATNSN